MRSPRPRRLTAAALAALLALAGLLTPAPRASAAEACFAETGHCGRGGFLDYWLAHGGLAINGYPLSEERQELLDDGKQYTVQYFERARLERHPENAPPDDILLGLFGRGILAQTDRLSGRFGALYITDERVRGLLGAPALFPAFQSQGATQAFEWGRMFFWREPSGFPLIAVLCGDAAAGQVFTTSRLTLYFADTWDPSRPAGGGPGPRPGLYEPTHGFGKIWRETRDYLAGETTPTLVRDCLGYATTPDETAYTITVQYFARGLLLSAPDGQVAYVLYGEARPGGGLLGRYERDALPAR